MIVVSALTWPHVPPRHKGAGVLGRLIRTRKADQLRQVHLCQMLRACWDDVARATIGELERIRGKNAEELAKSLTAGWAAREPSIRPAPRIDGSTFTDLKRWRLSLETLDRPLHLRRSDRLSTIDRQANVATAGIGG